MQGLVYPPTLSYGRLSTLSQPVPFTWSILLIQGFNFILYPIYNLCHCSTWTFQSSAFSGDHPKEFNQLHTICFTGLYNGLHLELTVWIAIGDLGHIGWHFTTDRNIFEQNVFCFWNYCILSRIFCTCSWNEFYRNWMVSLWELQPDGKFTEFLLFTRLFCCNNFGIVAEHSWRSGETNDNGKHFIILQ